MSYQYRLTFPKSLEYLKNEMDFIDKNYNFQQAISKKISFLRHILYWQCWFKFCRNINLAIKKNTNLPYFIHKNKIELEITTKCNLNCFQCDRSCRQAPSDEYMPVEQIKHFIHESIRAGKKWAFIVIIGGEPTLHPNIYEICDILIDYKLKHSPNTKITISTNGFSQETKQVLKNLPAIIHQENSNKISPKNSHFYTFNVAPVDLEKYIQSQADYSRGCPTVSTAGTAITRYGYYACGAAAGIDRVLGLNIGIKNVNDINEKALRTQLKLLCGYCGIFKAPKDDIYDIHDISPTWQKLYHDYAKKPPKLSLYGNIASDKAASQPFKAHSCNMLED